MKRIVSAAFLYLSLSSLPHSLSAQIVMSGTYAFARDGAYVTYGVEKITNYRSIFTTSGTLAIQLWATALPYSGIGTLYGYKLTETNLGQLQGGYNWSYIVRTQVFVEPPAGTYNIVFVLAEWNGFQYVTVDYGNFPTLQTFGYVPPVVAPTIIVPPQSLTVTVGQSASFSVTAVGTGPLLYQWKKNGVYLTYTVPPLTLNNVQLSDAGTYTVTVSNSVGSVTSAGATLVVNAAPVAPTISTHPLSQTVVAGTNVSLTVVASGTTPITYQWRKNAMSIAGATSATWNLGNVQSADSGSYSVVVSNSVGSVTSNAAALTVNTAAAAPVFTSHPQSQTVDSGQSVRFSSAASGTPTPAFQWRKNGANISGATNVTLTLSQVQPSDAGTYTVVATNATGSISSTAATLTVNFSRISNLSVRTNIASGQTLFVGFVTDGTKPILVRGVGPGMATVFPQFFGPGDVMADPRLELYNAGSVKVDENDNWNSGHAGMMTSVGAFALTPGSRDATLVGSINGQYTAQLKGTGRGVVLVDAYDTTATYAPRLKNVSARNQVGVGTDILIAGFVIDGNVSKTVLIRGIGPALRDIWNITTALVDPKLEIYDSDNRKIYENDNWSSSLVTTFDQVGAYRFTTGSKDAALLVTLPPGIYTAQVSGVGNTTGEGVVEVYEVP